MKQQLAAIVESSEMLDHILETHSHHEQLLFEFRLDLDMGLLNEVGRINPKKVILTYRSRAEGGEGEKDQTARHRVLSDALNLPVGFVDLELKRDSNLLSRFENSEAEVVVLSLHDYTESMESVAQHYLECINKLNPDPELMEKLVFKCVGRPKDALDAIEAMDKFGDVKRRVVLGIGSQGELTRTAKCNQEFVFGAMSESIKVLSLDKLMEVHSADQPFLLGLMGKSLGHSLSPSIHDLFLENSAMKGHYHLFEAKTEDRFIRLVDRLKGYGIVGVNVTIPYKNLAYKLADIRLPPAELVEAANTLKYTEKGIVATNTDISGFERFLEANMLDRMSSALVIGAGGGAKAVIAALVNKNFKVHVSNRSKDRILELPENLLKRIVTVPTEETTCVDADLYINTTPIGMDGKISPTTLFPPSESIKAFVDIAYSYEKTGLVKYAGQMKLPAFDGKEMLFYQAADSFEFWTESTLDVPKLFRMWKERYGYA